ncbi:DUF4160 domain-containing protein [Limibacterium fermenti]|uniref:DUF4160 domain-containing protein n=1 Tax=Limibacterium fermenti TaxID=3229863 RepID=UPI003A6C95E2
MNKQPIFESSFKSLIYANDHEPIHIHVVKGKTRAKFLLFPVKLVDNKGLKASELKMVEPVIEENNDGNRKNMDDRYSYMDTHRRGA